MILLTGSSGENGVAGSIHFNRTAGAIESWNRILKCNDHDKHRRRPDLFIKDHHPIMLGRQLSYVDDMTSSKKRSKLKVNSTC
jgi:hypothetical protein